MRRSNASIFTLILSLTAIAAAQQTPVPTTYVQTQSTGMIGIIGTQAARLSAVNLAAAGVAGSAASCAAHIAFLDDQGGVLKSADITVEPGKSAYVDFTPSPAGRLQ